MKTKKRVAWLLTGVMLLNMIPTNVYAWVQEGLSTKTDEGIRRVTVEHKLDTTLGQNNILPNVKVEWSPAPNNTNLSGDDEDKAETAKRPNGYRFELTDVLNSGTAKISNSVGNGDTGATFEAVIQDSYNNTNDFQNGKLYKLRVIPYHTYTNTRADGTLESVDVMPPSNADQPVKYFMTDFNTQLKDNEGKLEASWEYIQGATYELLYTEGNVASRSEMFNNDGTLKTGTVRKTLTDDEAKTYLKNNKVAYTITDAKAGQLYSACVIVTGLKNTKVPVSVEYIERNTSNPKVVQETTSVVLKVFNIAKGKIRLEWQLGDWLIMGSSLYTTTIYEKLDGASEYKSIGVINNAGVDPGYYNYREPSGKATYKVVFIARQDGKEYSVETKEVLYMPDELKQKPLQPQIPSPFSKNINVELVEIKNYLVKGDDIDKKNANLINNTFHAKNGSGLDVQLVWGTQNNPDDLTKIDYNLEYDLWVVESEKQITTYDDVKPLDTISILEGNKDSIIYKQDGTTAIGFKYDFSKYINAKGEQVALLPNKTYYVHLMAKRGYGSDIYAKSEPAVVAITLDKNGDISTPPVLAKPPLRLQENGVDESSIAIEWLEKWYEIKAKNPENYTGDENFFAKLWNSTVFTGGTPSIKFKAGDTLAKHELLTEEKLNTVKSVVSDFDTNYDSRAVSLGDDVKYEVKSILYDDVVLKIKEENKTTTSSAIQIEKWIVKNESDTTEGWTTVSPGSAAHSDGLAWKDYKVNGLKNNTRYIILIRAYRTLTDGTKLMQTFPSYVIATTNPKIDETEPTPNVPVLNPNGVSDSSVSVWWIYNKDFDYEVVYSRLEDPDSAISWPVKFSDTVGDSNYVSNGTKATVTITGLMPQTTYNVWIRAKQKKGEDVSSWSNPVTQTTSDIGTPDIPRGLGPAAYQTILEAGQDFKPISSEYITVEWLKDVNDVETAKDSNKTYSYILEFADNPEFLDAIVLNTDGSTSGKYEVITKNLVRFTGLEANKPYYVRVKTVLTFKDPENPKEIVKESEFCPAVRIISSTSSTEYDGGENENIVIYPEATVETYSNGVWTYEIVDTAKVISQMVNKKAYFLTITMENYKNKYDADVRRIKMDKSIVDTLINKGMALKVVTNVGEYEISGKALAYYAKQFSAKDKVQLDLTKATNYSISSIGKSYPEMLVKGERLQVAFKGKNKTQSIEKLDDFIEVKLILDLTMQYNFDSIYPYSYSYSANSWSKPTYATESQTTKSYFTFKTAYTGLYALYQKDLLTSTNQSTYIMNELKNDYSINGLGDTYFQKDYVYADQYIQLLLGIAQNKSEIDLTATVNQATRNRAKAAGLYTSASKGVVTQEQAIAGVIKLYELKQGYKIKASKARVENVSAAYKEAIGKAYAIGLIEEIKPANKVTYAQLCDWLIQVIE